MKTLTDLWKDQMGKEAYSLLCQSYAQPNEVFFRQNYLKNTREWNAPDYGECSLDFIPITNHEFLVLDRDTARINGAFVAEPYKEDGHAQRTIFSLLIADEGDIRKVMPAILEKRWESVYFVLNAAGNEFSSFFKLDGFLEALPPRVKFFATTEEMRQYFLNTPGAYLPKKIVAPEAGTYEALFQDIRKVRLQSGIPSDHVYLSVCIPSYNRGDRALESVRAALTNRYDAEIEIVLVNSGSTIGVAEYEQIKHMTDSRLRYYKYAMNSGFDTNFSNTLKKARGHFAIVLSDEDPLVVENMDEIFDYLVNHHNVGATKFAPTEGQGSEFVAADFQKGLDGLKWAHICMPHLSGDCFNMDIIREEAVFERMEKYKKDYSLFVQVLIGAFIATEHDVSQSGIKGWIWGVSSETGGGQGEYVGAPGVATFDMPDGTCQMVEGWVDFAKDFLNKRDLQEFIHFAVNITLANRSYTAKRIGLVYEAAIGSWLNLWRAVYDTWMKILRERNLESDTEFRARMDRSFFYWLICKRLQKHHTPEENLLPSLQAQVTKYYYDKGIPIEAIDFPGIEKDLEDWIQNFLEKGAEALS